MPWWNPLSWGRQQWDVWPGSREPLQVEWITCKPRVVPMHIVERVTYAPKWVHEETAGCVSAGLGCSVATTEGR